MIKLYFIIVVIFHFLNMVYAQTTYQGGDIKFSSNQQGVQTDKIKINDTGLVKDISLKFTYDQNGDQPNALNYVSAHLISPNGRSIILFNGYGLSHGLPNLGSNPGSSMYETIFKDNSPKSIYNSSSPYTGDHIPHELLGRFKNDQINGDWELVIYDFQNSPFTVSWELTIEKIVGQTESKEKGIEFTGSKIEIGNNQIGTFSDVLSINSNEVINNFKIELALNREDSQQDGLKWNSISLRSPDNTVYSLAYGSAINSSNSDFYGNSGTSMYKTVFLDNGQYEFRKRPAPYVGNFKPKDSFASLVGKSVNGNWTLIVVDNQNYPTDVEWKIIINYEELDKKNIFVSTEGDDSNSGSSSSPLSSIQYAINLAEMGDTLSIDEGVYDVDEIIIDEKNIEFKSLKGAELTILRGNLTERVLYIEDSVVNLDGITVQDGYDDGGGGIFTFNSTLNLKNSIIKNNETKGGSSYQGFGGGIYLSYSNGTFNKVTFDNNSGNEGGALNLSYISGNVTVDSCVFINNKTTSSGSAIEVVYTSSDNVADTVFISNSNFIGNPNTIEIEHFNDEIILTNSFFSGGLGYAINHRGTGYFELRNNSIADYTSENNSPLIQTESSFRIENLGLVRNSNFGRLLKMENDDYEIKNSYFIDNTNSSLEPFFGGYTFKDCIFYNNSLYSSVSSAFYTTSTIENSLTDFKIPEGVAKRGNIFKRPLFCYSDSTYRSVAANSPLLNSSSDGTNITGVEVGCESIDATKIYLSNLIGSDENRIALRTSPYATFSKAINNYYPNDTIMVMSGTYTERLGALSENYIFISESGSDSTIIDLQNGDRFLTTSGDLVLDGFTIKNAYTYGLSPGSGGTGGALLIENTSLDSPATIKIKNSIFHDNHGYGAGAIFADGFYGQFDIENCTFFNNTPQPQSNSAIYIETRTANGGSFINNIFWEENFLAWEDNVSIEYNIIKDTINTAGFDRARGNIPDDPLFLDENNRNLSLSFYSPARDAGDPNFPKDPDSTRADIGALYFDKRDIIPPTVDIENLVSDVWLNAILSINWTTNDNFPLNTMKIKLEYSTDFSSGVWTKIADSLSNNGSYSWKVPNIPSDDGGIKITATDYGGNTAADSSKIKFNIHYPSVSLEQLSTDTVKISEIVPIKWSTALAPEVKSVDLYYTIDDGTNWKDLSLNEKNDGEYLWTVPNEPTTTAGIRIVAKEQFGYTDTAEVKGIAIEIEYPKVTTIYPHVSTVWWTTQEIILKTNIILNPLTVNKNSVIVTSDQFNYSYSVSMNNDSIIIDFSSGLGTNDIISIKLNASMIKSPFGYEFDGNGDGTPGDDYLVLKKVFLPIDYNYDNIIDAQDVSLFIDYFKSNDLKWETAPVIDGTVPYIKILPDGKYDIDDMLTFVQFGNWYLQGASGKVADDIGHTPISLDTTIQSKDYMISLSESTKAVELYVKYDPTKLKPILEPTSGEVKLGHHDGEKGVISLIIYNPNDDEIRLHWEHLDKEAESDISVLTKTTDFNDQVTVKRSMLKVISVPNKFALHDNYPNPFNPTTTFKFDVPELSDITISIYNLLGQKVKTFNMQNTPAGYHSISWNATNDYGDPVGAGVYFYQLRANQFVKTKKMVLLK